MSKVVFADGSEVTVNDVSSVFAITLDTVNLDEIAAFKNKLTPANLKSFKIVNPNPEMCSKGENFKFIEIANGFMGSTDEEPTTTTFSLRPMTEVEKNIVKLGDKAVELTGENAAVASAVEDLALMISEMM